MKKRNIIFIIIYILIAFLLLGAYFINQKRDDNITSEIKSTLFNQISKDGIVVKDIKIFQDGKNIKMITTIKNKTNSKNKNSSGHNSPIRGIKLTNYSFL